MSTMKRVETEKIIEGSQDFKFYLTRGGMVLDLLCKMGDVRFYVLVEGP